MSRIIQPEMHKPLLVSLPISMILELDTASRSLNCSRSHLIRKSLKRDLRYVVEREVVEASKLRQTMSDGYENWLQKEKTETKPTAEKKPLKSIKEWWKERW
jgi:hypothetical protein